MALRFCFIMNDESFPSLDVDYNMCEFCSEKLIYIFENNLDEDTEDLVENLMYSLCCLQYKGLYFGPKCEDFFEYLRIEFARQHDKPGTDYGALYGMFRGLDIYEGLLEKE